MTKGEFDISELSNSSDENIEILKGIQQMVSESLAFDFLKEEEELYSLLDLKNNKTNS